MLEENKLILTWLKETANESIGLLNVIGYRLKVFWILGKAWKENKKFISRIPCGTYEWVKWYSPTFKTTVIRLLNVPERENILIHPLNFFYQSEGCMGVGKSLYDINGDGEIDITRSRQALEELVKIIPDKGVIVINKA